MGLIGAGSQHYYYETRDVNLNFYLSKDADFTQI
jgi:hypothetical protein